VKNSRRIKRMSRNRLELGKMPLTSLMDVFTILVFFLLVNSGSAEVLDTPKEVTLPESTVETKPRETLVIFVSRDQVIVQGEPVADVADIINTPGDSIAAITERLTLLNERVVGPNTKRVAESQEVTILADRSIPFSLVKRIMSTCTGEGYGRISLAVIQKGAEIAQSS